MNNSLPLYYRVSLRHISYDMQQKKAAKSIKKLAQKLVNSAAEYDLQKARQFENIPFAGKRPLKAATNPYFIARSTIGYEWSDPKEPSPADDYNQGYRTTFSGIPYKIDEKGYPVNPYTSYDKRPGRGILALWGPSQTVTNGVVSIQNNLLNVYGIVRRDDLKNALSGGYTKDLKFNTGQDLTGPVIYKSQTDEFFEEMISGSVTLLDEYRDLARQQTERRIEQINQNRTREELPELSEKEIQKVQRHVITEKKLDQVRENDSALLAQLNDRFATSKICYAGPMVASKANRRNGWVETYLSWFEMNKEDWEAINSQCQQNYKFQAGDDAQQAGIYEISPNLIENSSGSHSSYLGYIMASYLLHAKDISKDIEKQANDITSFYTKDKVRLIA